MTRFICKTCCAETPAGIGYAVSGGAIATVPAANCDGVHRFRKATAEEEQLWIKGEIRVTTRLVAGKGLFIEA